MILVIIVQCNLVNNHHQLAFTVLYTFIPSKLFRQLLKISLLKFTFLKTFNSRFLDIEIWFNG